ncbi:tetratricopeptide repeat protein [Variovorax sp. J22R24]|uniref:CHAT domain-containing tetratricopeptide repeat protein n=1 Tax=Variovorax gracilis TaxID=3053502 RepID=UPI002577B29C|nr:tetratricopeptide repeat protein [Variovorax sp. J22R24]MDM0110062.1 tetratricopeptide repeat protein [Variovorax sp. J22R24]
MKRHIACLAALSQCLSAAQWIWLLLGLLLSGVGYAQARPDATMVEPEWKPPLDALHRETVRLHQQGKFEEAVMIAKRALEFAENEAGADAPYTATSMNNLAEAYRGMGRYEEAIPLCLQALKINKNAFGLDHPSTATSLNNLAGLYETVGRYERALPLYEQALAIRESLPGPEYPDTAASLNNLAQLYRLMGRYEQALPLFQRALEINERAPDSDLPTASSLNNLALVYKLLSRYELALPLYERALAIHENLGPHHPSTAISLNNLAGLYRSMGRYEQALPLYQRALNVSERALGPDHPQVAVFANNLAELDVSMGQYERALPLLQQALLLSSKVSVTDLSHEHGALELVQASASNLGSLLDHWPGGARTDEAIVYYKISVNASQRMRRGTQGLDRTLRDSFTAKVSNPYRRLASLLVARGRLVEAERVLLLFKESELQEFVQRNGDGTATYQPLRWTLDEQEFADHLQSLAVELSKQVEVMADLRERIKRDELKDDGPEWRRAESQLQRLNERQVAALAEVSARLARNAQDDRSKGQQTALERRSELASRQANLRSRDFEPLNLPATASLTWLPGARGLTILVSTSEATRAVQVPAAEQDINKAAAALRAAIGTRGDYRPPARELYRWLIAPALPLLPQSGTTVQHLMLNAIGALCDIPFAALVNPDDDKHLIEGYTLSMITAQSASNLDRAPQIGWQIAGLGASISDPDFGNVALPAVREELCGIVRDETCVQGAIAGRRYEDPKFDRGELRHLFGPGNEHVTANVVHLATHYSVEKSQLLLGSGGALPLEDLVAMDLRLGKYDLLTLSACDSAVGGAGVESLAGLLQKDNGAKAVLATLWAVQDEGTAKLMVQFYRSRGEHRMVTKAEALRQAQIVLLQGKVRSNDAKLDLRHPYYWAPFVLMGNWL